MTVQEIEELCLKRGSGPPGIEVGQEWVLRLFQHRRCIEMAGETHRQRSLADADRSLDRDVPMHVSRVMRMLSSPTMHAWRLLSICLALAAASCAPASAPLA